MPEPQRGIDPRGPRFAAAITALLLLLVVFLGLIGSDARTAAVGWHAYQPLASTTFVPHAARVSAPAERAADPAFLLLLAVAALFLWGVVAPRSAPWGVLYRRLVQPRLAPPTEWEDPRPPRFAQGVGLAVSASGLVLQLAGVPWAVPIAAAAAFVAAFLNAAFGLCLGCQLYLLLQRLGLFGAGRAADDAA